MPKIKLENGKDVEISQESYDAFSKSAEITYEDVLKGIKTDDRYWADTFGVIYSSRDRLDIYDLCSESAVYEILLMIKLRNIADFFNGESCWKPTHEDKAWYIKINRSDNFFYSDHYRTDSWVSPVFKTREGADEAIRILGDELNILK